MKKTLLTLSLALLLCLAMALSVSAVVTTDDVGLYIRFDSQETIDQYLDSSRTNAFFDAENNCLRYITLPKASAGGSGSKDNALVVTLGGLASELGLDVKTYHFVAIRYFIPNNNSINGAAVKVPGHSGGQFLFNSGVVSSMPLDEHLKQGKWAKYIMDINHRNVGNRGDGVGSFTYKFDNLNNYYFQFHTGNEMTPGAAPAEVLIYDVGFFKDIASAMTYQTTQDYFLWDFSKNTGAWTNGGSYDAVEQAYYFENKYTNSRELDAMEYFNPSTWPYFSMYSKSTVSFSTGASTQFEMLARVISSSKNGVDLNSSPASDVMGSDDLNWFNDHGLISTKGGSYALGYRISGNVPTDKYVVAHKEVGRFYGNNENVNSAAKIASIWFFRTNFAMTGPKYIKYFAFYKTVDEATKQAQLKPTGVEAVAPVSATGLGMITGLDPATMEIRVGGNDKGNWTAVTATEMEVLPGVTYHVRYKAKSGATPDTSYNPGQVLEVSVPNYWTIGLTGFAEVEGERVTRNGNTWTVTVPAGTNLTSLTPVFNAKSGASETFEKYTVSSGRIRTTEATRPAPALYTNFVSELDKKAVVSGETALNFTSGSVDAVYLQQGTFLEKVTINVVTEAADNFAEADLMLVEQRGEESAIRFAYAIDEEWYNANVAECGVLITSKELMGDAVDMLDITYTIDDSVVVNVVAENFQSNVDGKKVYTAVITGIPEGEENTELVARGYVKLTNGDYKYFGQAEACLADFLA